MSVCIHICSEIVLKGQWGWLVCGSILKLIIMIRSYKYTCKQWTREEINLCPKVTKLLKNKTECIPN